MNLLVEEWGGKFQNQEIAAKKGLNIDKLLEKILLEAEILDLKANPDREATGTIIEASLDKGRGYVATLLVENGTLRHGDLIVSGQYYGRVKAMFNERGKKVKDVGPSSTVLVLDHNGEPQTGEKFRELENEQDARDVEAYHGQINREKTNRASKRISLDEIERRLALGSFNELNLIIKGDVHGTVEAIVSSVKGIDAGQDMRINVIHSAVGGITENDVLLASTSMAIIVGFNVRPEPKVRDMAKKNNIDIKLYTVIYDLIEDIKQALRGMLEPVYQEVIQGRAEVRDIFKVPTVGIIAGCMVTEGVMQRGAQARLLRDNVVIHEGKVESLRRFKDDAREVLTGFECGIGLGNYNDIKVGDIIESFTQEKVEAATTW